MEILTTILSLILFFIALGVLVSIHELGHLIAAKSFNVYCSDYSIGFGPKIFKHKRKNGETTFSIGLLPLGGYVSMYGEEGEAPDGINIPRSRSLEGIKRWKRIVIMAAGIVMNFVLAYIIFFISAVCFPNIDNFYINVVGINDETSFKTHVKDENNNELNDELLTFFETNPAMNVDVLTIEVLDSSNTVKTVSPQYYIINSASVEYNGKSNYVLAFDVANFNYNDTDLAQYIRIFEGYTYTVGEELPTNYQNIYHVVNNEIVPFNEGETFNIPLLNDDLTLKEVSLNSNDEIKALITFRSGNSENNEPIQNKVNVTFKKDATNVFERIGFGPVVNYSYLGWDSFRVAGENWVESTTLVSNALIDLFSKSEAWNNVGGPIAIFTQTTTILTNSPFYVYLNSWGIISVNLALFNLLPFPGLDGWQILVEIIEGIVNGFYKLHKKIKNKNNKENKVIADNKVINDENSNNQSVSLNNNEETLAETVDLTKEHNIVSEIQDDQVSINKNTTLVVGNNETLEKEKIAYDDEWHIPQKIKNIMSTVGLVLLFALFFVIIIKDVIGLF